MPRKPAAPKTVKAAAPKKEAAKKPVTAAKPAAPQQAVASPVPGLIDQLRRGELASRSAAAIALGELRDPQAVSALTEALRDSTAEIAQAAAIALGSIADASSVYALTAVVTNADGYFHSIVRAAAAESLARLKDPRSVDALIHATRDPIVGPSQKAIAALGEIGDARAIAPLIAVIQNADGYFLPEARIVAIAAATKFATPEIASVLSAVAAEPTEDPAVRAAAK
jgi:HEAT repeat protein